MKSRFFILVIMMALILGCAKPSVIVQNYNPEQVLHGSKLKNIENISNYAFYLDKGDKIPLKATITNEYVDIAHEEINFIIKQKLYFRFRMPDGINTFQNISEMSEEDKDNFSKYFMIYFSTDAISWAPYTNKKAIRHIFELNDGNISFGVGSSKKEGVIASLNVKI